MSLIKKIKINNFEKLKDFENEVGDFTVIAGKTDCGKSSLIRAFKKVLYNDKGIEITHGEKSCKIEIDYEGNKIEWKKVSDGSIIYKLNKDEYKKASMTPIDIKKVLGVEKDDLRVNISEQFKSLFLLEMSGSQLSDVINKLFKLDKSNDFVDLINKKIRDMNSEVKIYKEELNNLKEPDIRRIEVLKDGIELYKKLNEAIEKLKKELKLYEECLNLLNRKEDLEGGTEINVEGKIKKLNKLKKAIEVKDDYDRIFKEFKKAEKELQGYIKKDGICPITKKKFYKGCINVILGGKDE